MIDLDTLSKKNFLHNLKIVDLKKNTDCVPSYVVLRNTYVDQLLTSYVTVEQTLSWLQKDDVLVYVMKNDTSKVYGAVILYVFRSCEIAVFSREGTKGVASKLLKKICEVASEKSFANVHAWTLAENMSAQRLFERNGFDKTGSSYRNHGGVKKKGFTYFKTFS